MCLMPLEEGETLGVYTHRERTNEDRERTAICKSEREALTETKSANTLLLNFWLPDPCAMNSYC